MISSEKSATFRDHAVSEEQAGKGAEPSERRVPRSIARMGQPRNGPSPDRDRCNNLEPSPARGEGTIMTSALAARGTRERASFLFEHNLFRKPLHTFRDYALSPHSGLSGPRNWELIQPFQRVLST